MSTASIVKTGNAIQERIKKHIPRGVRLARTQTSSVYEHAQRLAIGLTVKTPSV